MEQDIHWRGRRKMSKSKGAPQKSDAIPVRYTIDDIERLRNKYIPGQKIKIIKTTEDGKEKQSKKLIVDTTYPYHVSCINDYGQRESFGYFELEKMER